MNRYIENLTNSLIKKNHYDVEWTRLPNRESFLGYCKMDLLCGDVNPMNPETLGKIVGSFEFAEVFVTKEEIFGNVSFAGDCTGFLREIVSFFLATVITDRLDNGGIAELKPYRPVKK